MGAKRIYKIMKRGVGRFLRYVSYGNPVAKKLLNSNSLIVLGGLSTIYQTGMQIPVFKNSDLVASNQSGFDLVTLSFMFLSSLIIILKGFSDRYESANDTKYLDFIEQLFVLTTNVVREKLSRFKRTVQNLDNGSNIFHSITQPKKQINLLMNVLVDIIERAFTISYRDLAITIIYRPSGDTSWSYLFATNENYKRTEPTVLFNQKSAASTALVRGEPLYLPDKFDAADKGEYLLSDRDKRHKVGSAFCYPVSIKNKNLTDDYVISIVTYGKYLADPMDREAADAYKRLFCEFCMRIELELTLYSIKQWSKSNQISGG